jgi:endonuclease/exonuclease/phosphatase family metal-dependent hydrolase
VRVPGKHQKQDGNQEAGKGRVRKSNTGTAAIRLSIFFSLLTLLFYYSCTIRPEKFWLAGFTGYLVPLFILFQLIFLAYWLWKKPLVALIPGITLFLGMRFMQAGFGLHYLITEKCSEFKVLSLNARTFGGMDKKSAVKKEDVRKTIDALIASEADILCIQEMHDYPGIKPFNIVKTLKKAGYPHFFYSVAGKHWGSSVGMAIFSKHPLLAKKVILKKEGSNNQIIMARIKLKDRRISVFNMHLQSVALKENELTEQENRLNWLERSFSIGKKLKKGFQLRAGQIDELLSGAASEGDYIVICGDMNDTPYSNAYLRLRDQYRNSFEDKGKGFGITFKGPVPFLRIDHQFYGKGLSVTRYETKREFPASDHHGTEACYTFSD